MHALPSSIEVVAVVVMMCSIVFTFPPWPREDLACFTCGLSVNPGGVIHIIHNSLTLSLRILQMRVCKFKLGFGQFDFCVADGEPRNLLPLLIIVLIATSSCKL